MSNVMNNSMPNIALVTGASQGIGQAIVFQLAAMGYSLVLAARSEEKLKKLADTLCQQYPALPVVVAPTDVQEPEALRALVNTTLERFGQIDVLINNAGVAGKIGLIQETSLADIQKTVAVNLTAPLMLMTLVLPAMVARQRGTIVNINSIAGKEAFPYWSVYDATKFGLRAATQAVSEEQRVNGIRVVGIYPGATDTAIWDSLDRATLGSEPKRDGMLRPETVAEAVAFVLRQPAGVLVSDITLSPTQPSL
ncbi:MAG: SDR family oxidoreductase [Candidatus Melainabacteria bacterium]|nr:SDR family oxidoreductase [Candidatus Melainabacteria bacterium]